MAWTIEYSGSVRKSARHLYWQVQCRIRDFLELRLAGMEDPSSSVHRCAAAGIKIFGDIVLATTELLLESTTGKFVT